MRIAVCSIFLLISAVLSAQSPDVPLNTDYYHLINRYEIKSGQFAEGFDAGVKPYNRQSVAALADRYFRENPGLDKRDRFNIDFLRNDNWNYSETADGEALKPIWNTFYRKKSDLYHVDVPHFNLHVNPVVNVGVGAESKNNVLNYLNTRGIELSGMIDDKIGFYTYLTENQANFPTYVRQQIKDPDIYAVPGEGFWKPFKTYGADFFTARGYVTFNATKHVNLKFGHDKNVIGNGYRSMILSDFSNNYLFLKINTKVWRITYTNVFAQMTGDVFVFDTLRPKKFTAFHRLGINVTDNLNIGLFETVAYGREDSTGNSALELNYLNPLIFYRSVEQGLGSPDNAILGLDFRWILFKRLELYGQLVLDEFKLSEVTAGNGWWANKQAGQLGMKYIDAAGIKNLDVQAEFNIARPYTYTHNTIYSNYAHYNQPLAHPLGANFYELIGIARYQPVPRLNLTGKLIYANYGADTADSNWGKNILLNNDTKEQDFGNSIGQGVNTNLLFLDFTASWQLFHNFFIDFKQIVRKTSDELALQNNTLFLTQFGIRWNAAQRVHEF